LSATISRWAGSGVAFGCALGVILVWVLIGPLVHSDTGARHHRTTIGVPDGVSPAARAEQGRAGDSYQLDELVAALTGASNRLIDVESLSEEELETLHRFYGELAALAKRDIKLSVALDRGSAGPARQEALSYPALRVFRCVVDGC
jgi:low affinity Fe/Cu permease